MKAILILLSLLFFVNINAQSDTTSLSLYHVKDAKEMSNENEIPFLVGSKNISGYKLESRYCINDESVTLSNGKKVAGLSCILFEKEEYVGGEIVFDGDTTVVKDITIKPIDNGAIFTVIGNDFNMSFTLITGIILEYESNHSTFYTKDVGIWTIRKSI